MQQHTRHVKPHVAPEPGAAAPGRERGIAHAGPGIEGRPLDGIEVTGTLSQVFRAIRGGVAS
ncbi:hypothetical protein [Streptomyces sp. MNP-20]|uniref:hypothetical protein n=1 Tax=Streptomyces sp. MNP-20 TaxID=2721165 RepID=UPI001557CD8E|nr:hypothetical protein [Streptomyces sp. MNP-20]